MGREENSVATIQGHWQFNKGLLVLKLTEHPWYEVDLERCTTSAAVLDWIIQVSLKPWATDSILAELVHKLEEYLQPQQNLCGSAITIQGHGRDLDVVKWLDEDRPRQLEKERVILSSGVLDVANMLQKQGSK
jgi:hypothetical protein